MSQKDQIGCIYDIVKRAVPTKISKQLKFLRPDAIPRKNGSEGIRGRILGTTTQSVWDAKWCFYEIGIGLYGSGKPNFGGIGFVSYPNNEKCGHGRNRRSLTTYVKDLTFYFTSFSASNPADPFQGAFSYYYTDSFSQFPTAQAAADLSALISVTFENFNRLIR